MENYSTKNTIKGIVSLVNKARKLVSVANNMSWLNPKKPLVYLMALVYSIGYYISEKIHNALDWVLFKPINDMRGSWLRGKHKAGMIKSLGK